VKYDIELLDPTEERRPIGTSFGHLSDATRFAMKLADDLRDPDSFRSRRFGAAEKILVRRANTIEMAITVFRKPAPDPL
jgi:hypothetical protein